MLKKYRYRTVVLHPGNHGTRALCTSTWATTETGMPPPDPSYLLTHMFKQQGALIMNISANSGIYIPKALADQCYVQLEIEEAPNDQLDS